MKRLAIALFALVMSVGMMVPDAEAKRLGGGRSSGMSRDSSLMKREAVPPKAPAAPSQAAPQQSGMSRWLGPVAGLAAGIGLASLFSHLGMGEGMANMVMILLLVMAAVFVFRLFMRKRQPVRQTMQYAGMPSGMAPRTQPAEILPAGGAAALAGNEPAANVPADFDVEGFLRQAKLNFIRLQAANDRGDMDDIRQFCTPEMTAEIQMQFHERGAAAQETNVMQLNAELLDVAQEADRTLASVRYSGMVREEADAAPESFSEVWHLAKPADGSGGWRIAGIQQS